uniref:Uncharacterized protein n=1 Tax=Tanacetum cinerariifolium TaxID=118510 RepID=A0A699GLX9_TANCI|nr:hypothetical protein [Tanacetum cinerariifolium]
MFDISFKRVITFEEFRTELVEGKENRARIELIEEITKKQKVENDKETTELKQFMEIILDEEEVAIDVIPLSIKEDLEDLYKLVKAKYESTRPMEDSDLLLLGDFKSMFRPYVEDKVWKMQQGYKVLNWKLYDSSGFSAAHEIQRKYALGLANQSCSTINGLDQGVKEQSRWRAKIRAGGACIGA